MNVKDYHESVRSTAVYPQKVDNFGLAYTYLGLIGEDLEIAEKYNAPTIGDSSLHRLKELGDGLWYTSSMCTEVGLDFVDLVNVKNPTFDKEYPLEMLAEPIKKYYRDGAPLNLKLFKIVLLSYITYIRSLAEMEGSSLEAVMQINHTKLMNRRLTGTIHGSGDDRENNSAQ